MEAILIYLLKSAGVLAIFFFSYQLFLKKETFFRTNRHYLLGGILGSLLLPLVIFTNYVYVEPVVDTFNPNWLFSDIPITYNVVEEAEPFNWFQFATYVYLLGVLILGIRFAIQLTSLFKLFKNNTIRKEDGFNFVEINSNISPFSFFSYIAYNPRNYYSKDGLQGDEFNQNAFAKDSQTGNLLFGGLNGFSVFNPDSLKDNTYLPPVAFTGYKRYNTDLKYMKSPVLKSGFCFSSNSANAANFHLFVLVNNELNTNISGWSL